MNSSTIIKLILTALLLLCLLDMPYGYYQLVRFVGMIGFGYLAYNASANDSKLYLIIWGASALLINPFFKITLGRELWNIVDVIWSVLLLISIKTERLTPKG